MEKTQIPLKKSNFEALNIRRYFSVNLQNPKNGIQDSISVLLEEKILLTL